MSAPTSAPVEHRLDAARGLSDALFVFDQRKPDKSFAFLAKPDPGRDRDAGILDIDVDGGLGASSPFPQQPGPFGSVPSIAELRRILTLR